MLQQHLLEHTAEGPGGLLFPGDRTDHMSVRYLMDRYRPAREKAGRPDLTIHHLRHTALTLAGQHGATAAELQARAGHASQAAMAIYQHATLDRDKALAERIGETYDAWRTLGEVEVNHVSVPPCRLVPRCRSQSSANRRGVMTELVPRDDIPDDEAALLDYLVQIVEEGRRRGGRPGQRRIDHDVLARGPSDLGQHPA